LIFLGGCSSTKEKPQPSLAEEFRSLDGDETNYIVPSSRKPATRPKSAPRHYMPKEVVFTQPDFDDLWDRIRAGYALPPMQSKHVTEYENWFASRPEYMARLVQRASPFLYHITAQVEQRDMPMEIALLPAIESAFKTNAISHAKAVGLWQFIPATGRHYGLKQNWWYDGRKDVYASTRAALDYLEKLNRDFDGDWFLALASYNAGEGTVSRAISKNRKQGKATDYQSLSLRSETRRYVPKLIAISNIIRNPEKYGLEIPAIENKPYFEIIYLNSQIDLGVIADSANIPVEDLEHLNPGFKRWATDPKGPHRILVKTTDAERVADAISGIPQHKRVRWAYYKVRKGDSLSVIARRHGVSVASLKKTNKLKSSRIRINQDLLIPLSSSKRTVNNSMLYPVPRTGTQKTSERTTKRDQPTVISVRKGDTLWSLSKRYKVSLNDLVKWNKINKNDLLFSGQKLKIWPY
jgi:membrane-bound lytic murein transglycosylase D